MRFIPLTVSKICADTKNAVVVSLTPPPEHAQAFNFIQGQYITFRKTFNGEELRRSYSICSGINDKDLRVGIKKVDGGWFSTWVNEDLKVGDTLEAMLPNGKFHAPIEPEKAKTYYAFAAGSGITPILSIVKTILENEPFSNVTLVYNNSSINTIMFKEELDDLKNLYMERFALLHVLGHDSGDIDMFVGRLTEEKCEQLFTTWLDPKNADYAFICGPEQMMLTVSAALKAHGMAKEKIKFELFKSDLPKKARAKTKTKTSDKTVKATIIIDGASRTIDMPAEGMSILEAAMENNIDVPHSCQAGVCSTCSAKMIEGEGEMEVNYGLEDYEVERGYVLTCQTYPLSKKITVDYDQ